MELWIFEKCVTKMWKNIQNISLWEDVVENEFKKKIKRVLK